MKIVGTGLESFFSSAASVPEISGLNRSFNSMLNSVFNHNVRSTGYSSKSENNNNSLLDVYSFLNTDNLLQVKGGEELLNELQASSNSDADLIGIVKDFLSISDGKWTSMLAYLGSDQKKLSNESQELSDGIKAKIFRLYNNGHVNTNLDETSGLFIKAAKLYNLLKDEQEDVNYPSDLSIALDMVKEKLEAVISSSNMNQTTLDGTNSNFRPSDTNYRNQSIHIQSHLTLKHQISDNQLAGNEQQSIAGLLSLLQTDDFMELQGGKKVLEEISGNPKEDALQIVKNALGIDENTWRDMLEELNTTYTMITSDKNGENISINLNSNSNQDHSIFQPLLNTTDQEYSGISMKDFKKIDSLSSKEEVEEDLSLMNKILDGFSQLSDDQLNSVLTKNNTLMIKAAKLYGLLINEMGGEENPTNIEVSLDSLKERLLNSNQMANKLIEPTSNENIIQSLNKWNDKVVNFNDKYVNKRVGARQTTTNKSLKLEKSEEISDLLSFFKIDNPNQMISTGNEFLHQVSNKEDILKIVKNSLGISNQRWAAIISELNNLSKDGMGNSTQEAVTKYSSNPNLDTNDKSDNATRNITFEMEKLQPESLETMKNVFGVSNQKLTEIIKVLETTSEQITSMNTGQKQETDSLNGLIGLITNQETKMSEALLTIKSILGVNDQKWGGMLEEVKALSNQLIQTETVETPVTDSFSTKLMGTSQLDLAKQTDILQKLLNISGNSDQEIPQIALRIENQSNQDTTMNFLSKIMTNLSNLDSEKFLTVFNNNTQQFLKTVKLYNLLTSKDDRVNNQILTGQLSQVQEKLQTITDKLINPQKTFEETYISGAVGRDNLSSDSIRKSQLKENTSEANSFQFGFQTMTKTEQLSIMLNRPIKTESNQEFTNQIETILAKSHFSKANGVQKLFIKLNPEHLGTLSIELVQKDQTIVAKILTSTQTAKDVLDSHLEGLKNALLAQNIHIDKLEIVSSSPSQTNQQDQFLRRDQGNQQQQSSQKQEQKNDLEEEETENSFSLSLESVLINAKV